MIALKEKSFIKEFKLLQLRTGSTATQFKG